MISAASHCLTEGIIIDDPEEQHVRQRNSRLAYCCAVFPHLNITWLFFRPVFLHQNPHKRPNYTSPPPITSVDAHHPIKSQPCNAPLLIPFPQPQSQSCSNLHASSGLSPIARISQTLCPHFSLNTALPCSIVIPMPTSKPAESL